MAYPGAEGAAALLAEMTVGSMAPFFWIEIVVGVIVPFAILVFAKNRHRSSVVALASAGVVVGVFCKRIWLLLGSFVHPNVAGAPGLISGSSSTQGIEGMSGWTVVSSYAPTLSEVLIVAGVFALGVLAFLVLAQRFLATAPVSGGDLGVGAPVAGRDVGAPAADSAEAPCEGRFGADGVEPERAR